MDKLNYYNKFRKVPETAKKTIGGGRLRGMTDINPMWRIKTLTETFGVCGFGWYYDIVSQELKNGANDEIMAAVTINLFIKLSDDGEWSKPIQGVGGSMFVTNESKGLYTSDECYKMALTDAISVACKALGIGADVYFQKDETKYNQPKQANPETPKKENNQKFMAAVNKIKKRIPIELFNILLSDFKLNNFTVTKLMDKTKQVEFYEGLLKIDRDLDQVKQ